MRRNQEGFGIVGVFLLVVILGLLGATGWYVQQAKTDNPPIKTGQAKPVPQTIHSAMVSISLTAEATGRPLANVKVYFTSDNGLRCESRPCPDNKKTWESTTDRNGTVRVPRADLQQVNSLEVEGYSGASFTYEATKSTYRLSLKTSPY